jgi:hypothetical protein
MAETTPSATAVNRVQAAAEQNVRSGVLLLCKEMLITAIQDRRLERSHLCVLACYVRCILFGSCGAGVIWFPSGNAWKMLAEC